MGNRSNCPTLPADFAEKALAMTLDECRAHYRISYPRYRALCEEAGIVEQLAARKIVYRSERPLPADFDKHAHLSNEEMKLVYPNTSTRTYSKWRAAVGASRHGGPVAEPAPADFKRTVATMYIAQAMRHYERGEAVVKRWAVETGAKFATWRGWKGPQAAPDVDGRSTDLAGQAQRHLQRIGPVYRRGDDYSVFGRTMPAGAMVEFAKGKGFDPDAWRRL